MSDVIEEIRFALAMRDAGYAVLFDHETSAELLRLYDIALKALRLARARIEYLGAACNDPRHFDANASTFLPAIDEVLGGVGDVPDAETQHRGAPKV